MIPEEITKAQNFLVQRELMDKLLVNQGITLIPIAQGTKEPVQGFALSRAYEGEYHPSQADLAYWRKEGYGRAAVCGPVSNNLIVLDFDSMEDGERFLAPSFAKMHYSTFTVRTSRGLQYWFKDSECDFAKFRSSIDMRPVLKGEILLHHHLAQCPLNLHPSGAIYTLVYSGHIWQRPGVVNSFLERLESLHWTGQKYKIDASLPLEERELDSTLTEEEIQAIVEEIGPLWQKGYRNKIVLSLSGLLIKKGVSLNSAIALFDRLVCAANDREARLNVLSKVRYQYRNRANQPNLIGYSGIKEVMEAVAKH